MSNRFYLDYHHFEANMPVPTWDCPELVLLDEQQSEGITTTNVVSEDIWKKFDLDFPQPFSLSMDRYYGGIEDGVIPDPYDRSINGFNSSTSYGLHGYEKSGSSLMIASSTSSRMQEAREIRHHDCMWAGLCISKEHNRTHPAASAPKKKEIGNGNLTKRAVPAGRSLLISRKQPTSCNQTITTGSGLPKNLESDGDSTRPETPQSCESESEEDEEEEEEEEEDDDDDEEEEEEDEIPRFKHDSISLNEKLSEYVVHGGEAVPISEVTGQLIVSRKIANRDGKKIGRNTGSSNQTQFYREKFCGSAIAENDGVQNNSMFYKNSQRNEFNRTNNGSNYSNSNTTNCTNIVSLGDHCYHLNQTSNSNSKKLEHLGVQTPSDSEEEIDVVTFDKPSFRPASSLPTNPSLADKQHLQKTVTSALKDKSPPRPRGRPPSNNTPRKRSAQSDQKPAKRPRHKTSYQKRKPHANNNNNNSKTIDKNENNNNNNNNHNNSNKNQRSDNHCINRVSIGNESNEHKDYYSIDGITRTTTRVTGDIKVEKNDRIENNNNNNSNNSSSNNNNSNNISNSNHNSPRGTKSNNNNNSSSSSNSSYGQSTSSRSATTTSCSDDEPETEKRSLHNNMERQRRIELRNAFEELRVLVPEVEMKEKAPKVVILRQAAVYCDMLTEIGQNTLATVNELKRRQDRLRTKLSQLRRNFRTERRGAEVRNHHQQQHHHHHQQHLESRRVSGLPG